MRVLLDANIYLSYLLTPNAQSAITKVVEAGISGQYTLLIGKQILDEVIGKVSQKLYLTKYITAQELSLLVGTIESVAEALPEPRTIERIVRDYKDDYLLTYAVNNKADYLVTGDLDLLELQSQSVLKIMTPSEFAAILKSRG